MPLLIIAVLIADLLSIASPFIACYFFREWNLYRDTLHEDYAQRCLWAAIAVLLFILVGRLVMRVLLSKRRRGEDEPEMFSPTARDAIRRPDGSTINVEYYGKEDAQAIIFVHGLNTNNKNWYYQRKYFEKNYRLIMMDMPGMGKSTRPKNKDYSLSNIASHLHAVIEHSGAKNPVLWGHSMGGMAILTYLAGDKKGNPAPVKGVILQHTTYTNPVKTILFRRVMTAIQKPVLTPLCYLIIILSPVVWINRWLSYLNGTAHIISRFLLFAGTQTAKQLDYSTLLSTMTPPAAMARGCLGMFSYDVTSALSQIKVPALVIAASGDVLTRPDASKYMHQQLANAQLAAISPANHQGVLERHKEVNDAVDHFLVSLR